MKAIVIGIKWHSEDVLRAKNTPYGGLRILESIITITIVSI